MAAAASCTDENVDVAALDIDGFAKFVQLVESFESIKALSRADSGFAMAANTHLRRFEDAAELLDHIALKIGSGFDLGFLLQGAENGSIESRTNLGFHAAVAFGLIGFVPTDDVIPLVKDVFGIGIAVLGQHRVDLGRIGDEPVNVSEIAVPGIKVERNTLAVRPGLGGKIFH